MGGPENRTFTQLAERLSTASGRPGRARHLPQAMLRALSVLARPMSPVSARQAQAAVVRNTTDLTLDAVARDGTREAAIVYRCATEPDRM